MPSQTSLNISEYYAHPRNCFWDIIASQLGIPRAWPYSKRLQQLRAQGIALWDVIQQCQRPGSLDSAIIPQSIIVNNFSRLLEQCPLIQCVLCNGGKAFSLYKKHVAPTFPQQYTRLKVIQLPSTSPANAGMRVDEKQRQWGRYLSNVLTQKPPI